ncbi:MAG: hypothetical protein JNJ54_23325 [Myxococcaceae bacterium]|nr:hypothetical protein [Myxococcaceae bacterium]
MSRREPTVWSSLTLIAASLVIGGVGVLLAPWADAFWVSTREPFAGQSRRDAGELAWEISSFLLFCGAGGIFWGVRDLIAGLAKKRP